MNIIIIILISSPKTKTSYVDKGNFNAYIYIYIYVICIWIYIHSYVYKIFILYLYIIEVRECQIEVGDALKHKGVIITDSVGYEVKVKGTCIMFILKYMHYVCKLICRVLINV